MKIIKDFDGFNPYYFWKKTPFTQWTVTEEQFVDKDGNVFCCMEQYMMFRKAELFGDVDTSHLIMNTNIPAVHKRLGRGCKGFDEVEWNKWRLGIVIQGNLLKFQQNPKWAKELKDVILNNQYFVESSPYDKVWGIGINTTQALSGVPWRGENLLGVALTNVAMELVLFDQLLYQEDIQSVACVGVGGISTELDRMGINSSQPNVVNLIENDLYDIMVQYLEEHFGIGQYRNYN